MHYLTKRDAADGTPGAVTMDVDFGISLAASGDQYGTIKSDLAGLDFKSEGNRLVRKFGNLNLYLDFLTEDPPSLTGARIVDDVVASVIPGLNRALDCHRIIAIKGRDLYGAHQVCKVAVADIGPMLVLKLNAFGGPTGRRLPKDAYDVLLAVTRFVDGAEAAVVAFRTEARTGNTGYEFAQKALQKDFSNPDQDGPIRAAEFHPGNAEDRGRVRENMVTVGRMLLED